MIAHTLLALALSQTPTLDAGTMAPPDTATSSSWTEKITFSGFSRVMFGVTVPFNDEQLVGSNGGFRVADLRLAAEVKPVDKIRVVASLELSAAQQLASDPQSGQRAVELRDGFIEYAAHRFAVVRAGQFRPPYYVEMMVSDGEIPFTGRSVVASGINSPEGFGPREGIAPDRQVGVQVASEKIGGESVNVRYAVGVFNGNGQNTLFNDNNAVAPFGRVEVGFAKIASIGVNGYQNTRSIGVRPNRLFSNDVGYGADVSVKISGFTAITGFLGRSSTYQGGVLSPETANGILAQAGYVHESSGFEGAARVARLEPSSAQVDDQVTEITVMAGWRILGGPARLILEYRQRVEEPAASIDNNSVNAMIHLVF